MLGYFRIIHIFLVFINIFNVFIFYIFNIKFKVLLILLCGFVISIFLN